MVHASGFLAVYLAALVPRQRPAAAPAGDPRLRGGDGLAGPDRPVRHARPAGHAAELGRSILPALGIGLVLLLVARPLAVLASVSWLCRSAGASSAFLSWAGLRGAVPIVLATVPGRPSDIFNLVFVLVIVYTVVQGPTLPWVGAPARVLAPARRRTSMDIESSPLLRLDADLLQTHVATDRGWPASRSSSCACRRAPRSP